MSEKANKKTFDVLVGDKPVKLAVLRPTNRVLMQADLEYKRSYRQAVEAGLMIRAKAEQVLADQWGAERSAKYAATLGSLLVGEKALAAGGMPLSKARELAVQMRVHRAELRELLKERNAVDANTAEAHAEQSKFNYLVSVCTVHADSGSEYYTSVDDYLGREDDPAFAPASNAMARMQYGLDEAFERNLPENRFLVEHKLADPKTLHLVRRKDGKPVDARGRLVDEHGRLLDEQGNLVSADGTPMTEEGEFKMVQQPFEDDLDDGFNSPAPLTPTETAVAEMVQEDEKAEQEMAA